MRHRVMGYWVRDGSWEIAFGIAFTVGATIVLLGRWLTEWPGALWDTQFFGWLILAGIVNSRRQRKEMRSGGYMEPSVNPWVAGGLIAAAFFVIQLGADLIVPEGVRGSATDFAMVIGLGYLAIGFLTRLSRYFFLGALSLAGGVWVTMNGWGDTLTGLAAWGLLLGPTEILIGLLAWRRYPGVGREGAEGARV